MRSNDWIHSNGLTYQPKGWKVCKFISKLFENWIVKSNISNIQIIFPAQIIDNRRNRQLISIYESIISFKIDYQTYKLDFTEWRDTQQTLRIAGGTPPFPRLSI